MNKIVFFKRLLKAIVRWFNMNLYRLCKFTTCVMKRLKYRSELKKYKYYDISHWENY